MARKGQPGVVALIAIGGALGSLARYGMSRALPVRAGSFPWATFLTNLSGAFVLALFLTFMLERSPPSRWPRPFFAVGFIGAYTTFSTMAVDTVTLVKDGHVALGGGYLFASVAAGLAIALVGAGCARSLSRSTRVGR
jgi:fluoride exporter